MSWFDASNFANLAKNALKEAQKTIDKALDITEDEEEGTCAHFNNPAFVRFFFILKYYFLIKKNLQETRPLVKEMRLMPVTNQIRNLRLVIRCGIRLAFHSSKSQNL